MNGDRALGLTIALYKLTAWTAVIHVIVELLQGHLNFDLGLLAFAIVPGLRARRRVIANRAIAYSAVLGLLAAAIAIGVLAKMIRPEWLEITIGGLFRVNFTDPLVPVAFAAFDAALCALQLWLLCHPEVRRLLRDEAPAPGVAAG
jgi:hypothetical protein